MKKSFSKSGIILLAISGVLFLQGCQLLPQNQQPADVDEQPLDRRIGLIQSLGGIRTSNQGTHLLKLDNGDTILLKSLQINLDDPQYAAKTVEVRGILTYTTDKKQIMEAMNIDVLEDVSLEEANAPKWKEFNSAKLGFSIKYRDDLKIDVEDGKVSFEMEADVDKISAIKDVETEETAEISNEKEVTYKLVINRSALARDQYFPEDYLGLKNNSEEELLGNSFFKSKIGAQSYTAYKKTGERTGSIKYYVNIENWVYVIDIIPPAENRNIDAENLFFEMLTTLNLGADVSAKDDEDTVNNNENEDEDDVETQENETEKVEPADVEDDNGDDNDGNDIVEEKPESDDDTDEAELDDVETVNAEIPSGTQETIEGFSELESEGFNFSVQYPKSWYYSGSASDEESVIRHYEFGTKPLDEEAGSVSFDLISGSVPAGTSISSGGNTVTKVSGSNGVELYVKGSGSRIYRISGPSSQESTLLQMAGSVEDL